MVDADVLIVGAGPVGLAAACELTRHGLSARVIDKEAGLSGESKALAVHARTLELFEKIGVTERFLVGGLRLDQPFVYDGPRLIAAPKMAGLDTPYPFVLSIPQATTERLLAERFREMGGDVYWNTSLTAISPSPDGVNVTLNRSDGQTAETTYPWVIGCDGAHSTVRHLLGIGYAGERSPEWFGLADAPLKWEHPNDRLVVYLTAEGPVATIPLPGGNLSRVIFRFPGASAEVPPTPTREDLEELMRERCGIPVTVGEPVWVSEFQISRRLVSDYRRGRVLLAGDAAHIHSPVGGQGMNTGIQDAFNLSWKLALVHSGLAPDSLLDSYHSERHPVGKATLRGTGFATRFIATRSRFRARLRNWTIRLALKAWFVRRRLMRSLAMLRIGYAGSPVVGGDGPSLIRGGPAPGGRAPDAECEDRRLYDVLRSPRHVLLIFVGDGSQEAIINELRHAEAPPNRFIDSYAVTTSQPVRFGWASPLVDSGKTAHRAYGAIAGTAVLVRPDGYVGWRADQFTSDSLQNWLSGRIFS